MNIWRKCLIKYLMLLDIPDHLKPNVFLIRASGRPTGGLYTCNSLIYWNKTEIWDLGGKIGTFLGPFLHFGPIWDQVPNSGPYRSPWTCKIRSRDPNCEIGTIKVDRCALGSSGRRLPRPNNALKTREFPKKKLGKSGQADRFFLGGGSKAIWNFSEKTSVLVFPFVP